MFSEGSYVPTKLIIYSPNIGKIDEWRIESAGTIPANVFLHTSLHGHDSSVNLYILSNIRLLILMRIYYYHILHL